MVNIELEISVSEQQGSYAVAAQLHRGTAGPAVEPLARTALALDAATLRLAEPDMTEYWRRLSTMFSTMGWLGPGARRGLSWEALIDPEQQIPLARSANTLAARAQASPRRLFRLLKTLASCQPATT